MFSIYHYDHTTFSGTLENLITVKPPTEVSGGFMDSINHEQENSAALKNYLPSKGAIDTYRDLIHADPRDQLCHAHEIMRQEFPLLKEDLPLNEALVQLTQQNINSAPVVNDQGRFVGVIRALNILEKLIGPAVDLSELRINQVRHSLSPDAITSAPVTSIRRIAQVIQTYSLDIVPIVDHYDAVVGVVTPVELASAISKEPPLSVWT